ncbi:MAG TPA: oligosaccharide flippase family protein [Vicinamibacterales bacterium]|nr:oligosaccharide flippase family protein [Vicinamibacterales bacterium]
MSESAAPVRFADGSFRIFRRDALVYLAQIFTGAVVARTLGPEAMGLWIILQMIPSYAEPIGRIHFDSASCYFISRGTYRIGEVSFAVVVATVVTSALLIAAFLWQSDRIYATFLTAAVTVPQLIVLMLASIPVRFLTLNYSYLLLSREDVDGYNRVAVLNGLAPSLAGAALVLTGFGLPGLVLATLGGGIAAVVYGAFRIHRDTPMVVHVNTALFRDLFSFGSKLYLQQLVGYFHVYASGLLVLLYLPASSVAFFRMGQDRALLLSRVPNAAGTLLYPRISRLSERPQEARELTAGAFRMVLWILLALGAIAAVLATPAVLILYGEAYRPVILMLVIFIPGVVFEASSGLILQHFTGRGNLWLVVGLAIIGLIVQLALLWVAIPAWGLVGAAAAASASYVSMALLRLKAFVDRERIQWRTLLVPTRADFDFVREFIGSRLLPLMRHREAPANTP